MKPNLSGVCAALLCCLVIACPTVAAEWTLTFQDDFSRTEIGTDWVIQRGDWHIKDGKLHIVRDWSSDSSIRTAARCPGNVRLTFDVEVPGPYFVKAAVRIGDQYWDGGGPARAGRGARGGSTSGEVVLAPAGAKPDDADFRLQPNQVHRVVVQYDDGRFQAWVDDKQVVNEKADLSGRFNDYAALFAIKDAVFDNVRVFTKSSDNRATDKPRATPEANRRATVDARTFIDPSKPAQGIQAAIDSLPASGGAVILPKGEFVLHQSLFLREGVCLRGQGAETKLALPSPIVWTTLTEPAAKGDTMITVAEASAFKSGAMLCLGVDPMYYLRSQEPWRVRFAAGNMIELSRPLQSNLKVKTPVGNWFPIIYAANASGIEVRDLDIIGRADDPAPFRGGYGASAVTFFFVREARVCNVNVHGWKGDAFSFQGGRDNLLSGCSVVNATEKGYHPGSCQQRMIISRCRAEDCGDDGFFFCRYNQLSAMGNNRYYRNRGSMIGGLAKAGDMFNTINRNFGKDNRLGMSMGHGANDVMVGNVVINTQTLPIIEFAGGDYSQEVKQYHPYTGPARYHVVASNVFVQSEVDSGTAIVAIRSGAGANVIANNQGIAPEYLLNESGNANVVVNNRAERSGIELGWIPPSPPSVPNVVVDASVHYDPTQPDCGFQKAIDQAREQGGTVQLPAGVYTLTKGLVLPSNITLCGEGIATRLIWRGGGAAIRSANTRQVAVRRLELWAVGGEKQGVGISLENVTDALLEGVNLIGCEVAGLKATGTTKLLISGCRARSCGVGYDLRDVAHIDLVESWALEGKTDGVRINGIRDTVRIDSCVMWFNRRHGVIASATPAGMLKMMSNVISNSGRDGVALKDCIGTVIRANVIHNSGLTGLDQFAGVLLSGKTRQTQVIENRIGDELYDARPRHGIRETDGASSNTFRHNAVGPCQVPFENITDALVTPGPADAAASNAFAPFYLKPKQ